MKLTGIKMKLPPSLLTGHPEVDAQHARILDELERIRGAGPPGIAVHVAFLRQHIRSHFYYEELLMEEAGYPDIDTHMAEHRKYADTVARLLERMGGDEAESFAAIVAAVEAWVVNHVMRADHKLTAFLRAYRQA